MENSVIFVYNGLDNSIQCKKEDKMKDICLKFANKIDINIKEIYFLYGGENIDLESTYEEIIDPDDLKRGQMKILIYDNNNNSNKNISKIKSEYVICPICSESCFLNIKNFKVSLYGCKNGHKIDNLPLDEFEKTQKINESKIKCSCSKTKSETYKNLFYKCFTCPVNLCPLCKSRHDKKHIIIDYDKMNYICIDHNESFISYCDECKINLCMQCEENHINHKVIEYRSIMTKKDIVEEELKEFRKKIDKIKEIIVKIITILNKISENMEIYYKINSDLINNYDVYKRNYQIFRNINEINNNIEIKDIDNIINENNIYNQFKILLDIYNKMNNQNNDIFEEEKKYKKVYNHHIIDNIDNKEIYNHQTIDKIDGEEIYNHQTIDKIDKKRINGDNIDNIITIKYKIEKNTNEIKIFGKDFVNNNKDKCHIIYNDEDNILQEYFLIKNFNKKNDILEIKLQILKEIIDFSDMFDSCKSLLSLPNICNLDTKNVIQMNGMFRGCSSLSELSDISIWDTSKVTNMNGMFNGCRSLTSIPDISKWDTSNVTNMGWMFYHCKSLKSLPDISKWNTDNVINMENMFEGCKNNLNIPIKFKR